MTREIVETLKRVLKARSMTYADLAGALRVAEGLTTMEEVIAATPPLE